MAGSYTDRPEQAIARAQRRSAYSDLISFPSDIGPHTMLMVFKEYSYDYARAGEQSLLNLRSGANGTSTRRETIGGTLGTLNTNISAIELPIPSNLRDTDILNIERITQSALENALGEGIATGANALQSSGLTIGQIPGAAASVAQNAGANFDLNSVLAQGTGALNNILQDVLNTTMGNASRDVTYLLRSTIDRYLPGVSRVADRALGTTVNPKASLAFEGVELKQHSFNWFLAPKNQDESERMKNIVQKLKQSSLPTYQTFIGTSFKAYLRYPAVVDVYLLGVNPDHFVKFKSSMIRSVNVDYGSSGLVSVLKGGKPGNITLNIELVELDIHTAEDYGGVGTTSNVTVSTAIQTPGFLDSQ
jgi:hypothetical protein